jgi:hypothetical protein
MSRARKAWRWLALWVLGPACLRQRERWAPSLHRTLYAGRDRA